MLVQGVWMLVMGKESAMNATGMIITMAVFSVLTMVVFLWAKWSVVSRHWVRTRPWFVLFWCVLAALGALIPSVWIQEHMPELPNIVEGEFDMIMKDRWGYLVVGLLAPLAEEMVFRGAVLRSLLRWKENPWIGIVISAVLFAVIHMNPAQMPHAFLIGLLLGWLYYRTDSIVPGVVYHWVNNTVAYVMYNLYPNPDLTLVELFGTEQKVLMALGCSLLIFLPSLFQLNQRLNK
jgi:hypothetical protein